MHQNKHNAYEQPTDYSAQSIVYKKNTCRPNCEWQLQMGVNPIQITWPLRYNTFGIRKTSSCTYAYPGLI